MADDLKKDERVGYKKPPLATQFKPGKSGNPKGRPKGSMDFNARILKFGNMKVRANGPNGPKKIAMDDAVLMQLAGNAAKGHLPSARLWLQYRNYAASSQPADEAEVVFSEADKACQQSYVERTLDMLDEIMESREPLKPEEGGSE